MRVTKDVVNAIRTKFQQLAEAKMETIAKPKHSSEEMARDLRLFIQSEVMKELPTILALYQKKHPSAKFNSLDLCKKLSFDDLNSYRFTSLFKLDEEINYEKKIHAYRELKEKLSNEIVLRLPFIKTQEEYDDYLAEVEKQFK